MNIGDLDKPGEILFRGSCQIFCSKLFFELAMIWPKGQRRFSAKVCKVLNIAVINEERKRNVQETAKKHKEPLERGELCRLVVVMVVFHLTVKIRELKCRGCLAGAWNKNEFNILSVEFKCQ